jgi:photosystem II stability/assembly factor-like uncharacterized protein
MAQSPNGDLFLSTTGLFKSTDDRRTWNAIEIGKANCIGNIQDVKIGKTGRILIRFCSGFVSDDNGKTFRQENVPSNPIIDSMSGLFYFDDYTTIYSSALGLTDTLKKRTVPNSTVSSLISHPIGGIIAFTYDNNYSVLRSVDGGNHWIQINYLNSSLSIFSAVALDSSLNVLATTGGYIVRSTDSGNSWSQNSTVLTQGVISAIAVDKSGDIFATSSGEGVFRSTDNGITWDQLNKGIIDQGLYSLAVHQNGDIFVGAKNAVYRSTNQGLNWTLLNTNFPKNSGNVSKMIVSSQGNIIAGIDEIGIYWSTDNGISWTERASGFTGTKVNSLLSTPSGKVFAASDSGLFYLDITPGINWIPYNDGIVVKNTLSLCRDQSGRLYCGTLQNGVYGSTQTFNIVNSATNESILSPSLGVVYPNPISTTVTVPFIAGERSFITIDLFDALGRLAATIVSNTYETGSYSVNFDVSSICSGTYYLKMRDGSKNFMRPIIVRK